jgi:hypothetical protein
MSPPLFSVRGQAYGAEVFHLGDRCRTDASLAPTDPADHFPERLNEWDGT